MNKTDTAKLKRIHKQLRDMWMASVPTEVQSAERNAASASTMHNLSNALEAIGKELNQEDR